MINIKNTEGNKSLAQDAISSFVTQYGVPTLAKLVVNILPDGWEKHQGNVKKFLPMIVLALKQVTNLTDFADDTLTDLAQEIGREIENKELKKDNNGGDKVSGGDRISLDISSKAFNFISSIKDPVIKEKLVSSFQSLYYKEGACRPKSECDQITTKLNAFEERALIEFLQLSEAIQKNWLEINIIKAKPEIKKVEKNFNQYFEEISQTIDQSPIGQWFIERENKRQQPSAVSCLFSKIKEKIWRSK